MSSWVSDALQAHYITLHFTAGLMEDTVLPVYKASALRGGMGQMLLDTNCISSPQGDCEHCLFPEECMVQRVMYSRMDVGLEFMNSGNSVGYVVECENYREQFQAGDTFTFKLILFGKNVMHFSQYLNAFIMLGARGLGRERGRFQIMQVANSARDVIYDGRSVQISRYQIRTIRDYVNGRLKKLESPQQRTDYPQQSMDFPQQPMDFPQLRIDFKTPLDMKHKGEKISEFDGEVLLVAVARRLRMLNAFEGRDIGKTEFAPEEMPVFTSQQARLCRIPRYSFHKEQKVWMRGIEGEASLQPPGGDALQILLAGELIHAGSNTSYGLGRYHLTRGNNHTV